MGFTFVMACNHVKGTNQTDDGSTRKDSITGSGAGTEYKDTAFLSMKKQVYSPLDTVLYYDLENYTGKQALVGRDDYDIEMYQKNGKWTHLHYPGSDMLLAQILKDKVSHLSVPLYPVYKLSKGKYRLVKVVSFGDDLWKDMSKTDDIKMYVEFYVK